MKKFVTIFMAMTAVLASCRQEKGNDAEDDSSKLKYSAQINEVETVPLVKQDFCYEILSNGKLTAARKAALSFKASGPVSVINAENGRRVARGEIIAEIENSSQKLDVEAAELSMKRAELDLKDVLAGLGYSIRDLQAVPDDAMDMAKMRSGWYSAENTLKIARNNLEGTIIRAPYSGKVAGIRTTAWSNAPSEAFCYVIDDSSFNVEFTILESEYGVVCNGLGIRVTPFGSDAVAEGRILNIDPSIDKNGQITVKGSVKNTSGTFLDGMNVKVRVEKVVHGQFVVPKSAVLIRDNLEVLFRYRDGESLWTYVNTVAANSTSYIIEANEDRGAQISEGDQIIVSGNLNLADGSKVQLKNAE